MTNKEEEEIPKDIEMYMEQHDLENNVNAVVNRVLKERPSDPIQAIASELQKLSPPTYPQFEKLSARRVFLQDNPSMQSLKIHVYLTH